MDLGIKIASDGMRLRLKQQEIIAQNIANLNTEYYKNKNLYFSYNDKQIVPNLYIDMECGAKINTENKFDLYLDKNVFLKVMDENNNKFFIKDGRLNLNEKGELIYKNYYVLDVNDNKIYLNNNSNIIIMSNGDIIENNKIVGKLGLYRNPEIKVSLNEKNNLFYDLTSPILHNEYNTIYQGFREASNVNRVNELIKMISGYHIYESCQKAIMVNDEVINKTINELNKF